MPIRVGACVDQRAAPLPKLWPKAAPPKSAGGDASFGLQGRGGIRGGCEVRNRDTQRGRILRLLQESSNQWVPSYQLANIALQYGARVLELRRQGYKIENKLQDVDGETHGAFRLVPAASQARLFETAHEIPGTRGAPAFVSSS